MVEFPGKGKTNSVCPPLLFGPRLISSKTRWKKKKLLFLSIPFHKHIGRTIGCTEYLPGFPWARSPHRILQAAGTEDLLKVPTGAGWKFHRGSKGSLKAVILYHHFSFKELTLCTSSCTWTLDPRWGPVQTAFPCPIFMPVSQASRCHLIQHSQGGSIILQVLSPECRTPSLKAEMLTTCARMLQLLLSYFIITTAHKQKCFTLKDFLGWILMLFFSPAHRWGLSMRRINVGE